jgi:AAA15 family ATPase/GTPase
MKDFSTVNVLLGANNSGKTSVLESIFLLSDAPNPEAVLNLNLMRGMKASKDSFKSIFYNLETANTPLISGDFLNNIHRTLEIAPIFETGKEDMEIPSQDTFLSTIISSPLPAVPDMLGLKCTVTTKEGDVQGKPEESWIRFEKEGIKRFPNAINPAYNKDTVSMFMPSGAIDAGLSKQVEPLFVAKREGILNDLLNKFDSKIKGLYVLPNSIYIDKEGISERIPLQLMGVGLRRFLNVAATIAAHNEQNFIYLLDEIENGLHYKTQEQMWETIFTLIRSANIQIFITTHSWEMLQSLTGVLKQKEYAGMQDSVKVFSIVNTVKAGFQSYVRSVAGLDFALENVMEIR